MEVTEVKRQRLISVVPLWGFAPFCHHFMFVCGKHKDPSVQPKMLCFPDAALRKRSVRCVGGENWKKQATDRDNSSSLPIKNESWRMWDLQCYVFSLCRCCNTQQESLPLSLPLQHPAGWHVTAWCASCLWQARQMNKASRNERNSNSIFICNSCVDQKINYCCSEMHSLQLCNGDHTKEASWCKFPVILPVLLASARSSLFAQSLMWFATCCWKSCCCTSSLEKQTTATAHWES